jgi:alpha-L-fucosidase
LVGGARALRAAEPAVTYTPTAENLEARRWYQDAKFGLFVHWGVYSVLADGEWVMNNRKLKVAEYERLPPMFNPTAFNAAEWVALVKAAGIKYITITSKHHDGFAMFDSKVTDWDIVDRTPYKKDPLKQLADECRKQGIKLFFYYSQLDWHHPDYFPRGRTGQKSGRPDSGDWSKYIDFMDAQLTELLTRYGPVGGIWFDGWWDRKESADWRLGRTYGLIHKLQPAALVGSNHHLAPFAGEDFQMFERDLPGNKTSEFNADSVVGQLPLETCDTINGAWGFNVSDRKWKSAKELVQTLAKAAGMNANLLLNVGPQPNGQIPGEQVQRLRQMGVWLKKHGDSIYGTRGGPVAPRSWGVTTKKASKTGSTVFVHVLDWQDPILVIPPLGGKVRGMRALEDGTGIKFQELPGNNLMLEIPASARNEYDTVIAVDLAAPEAVPGPGGGLRNLYLRPHPWRLPRVALGSKVRADALCKLPLPLAIQLPREAGTRGQLHCEIARRPDRLHDRARPACRHSLLRREERRHRSHRQRRARHHHQPRRFHQRPGLRAAGAAKGRRDLPPADRQALDLRQSRKRARAHLPRRRR